MSKIAVRIPALMAFVLLMPVVSAAQTGEVRRPYRALFGGDPNDATSSSLTINFDGGYEENVRPTDAGNNPALQANTLVGGVSASLTLQRAGEKASYGLSATSSLRYVEAQDEIKSVGHGAQAFTRLALGQRASVNMVGSFMWAPLYNPLLSGSGFGGEGLAGFSPTRPGADYATTSRPAIFVNGAVYMDYAMSRRATFSAGYSLNYDDYTDEDQQQRGDRLRVGASYRLTKYSSLRFSYNRTMHHLEHGGSNGAIDDFGGGIDYRRPFSISGRRTTFMVTPGMALDRRSGSTRFQAIGSATLAHEIGRTWTAKAAYHRGFRFTDGLDAQMLANTGTAYVEGLVSRRVSVLFGGQVTLSDKAEKAANDYQLYSASGRISYALTRNISTYAQYVYYSYQFGDSVVLPTSVIRRLDRQGIRVGISLWTPILR
jgi:hypothetical protein